MLLHYKEIGEGKPLVILHGLFGTSDNWQTHAKKLGEYYRVILVDQRNHGHSPWSEDFTYEYLADDLERLIIHLGIDQFTLIGHSMGGKTAMYYSQKYPTRVEKMVIVDIGIKQYPMHHNEIIKGIKSLDLTTISSRSAAEQAMIPFVDSYGVRQFLLKNLYWVEKGKLAWRMNVDVLEREMEEILAPIPNIEVWTPTLFLRGAMSNYILDEDWDEIEEIFPDATLETIENAGHWVHSEQPDEFIEKVLGFIIR
jgi:pimeloyl-ACP methyl ester carboxylesterase